MVDLPFIITKINNVVLGTNANSSSTSSYDGICIEKMASTYNLDFKQKAAFEIIATSFVLESLQQYDTSPTAASNLFDENQRCTSSSNEIVGKYLF